MKRAGVKNQFEVRANVGHSKCRYIGMQDPHGDARLPCALARLSEGFLDDVDASYLPTALGELDSPDSTPGSEVERRPVGGLAPALFLLLHQFCELPGERGLFFGVLPWVETEGVGEPVIHTRTSS